MKIRRAFGVMFTGTVVSQIVALAASLFVARIYEPSDIGTYAALLAVAAAFVPLATLRVEATIPPAGSSEDAAQLTSIAFDVARSTFLALVLGCGVLASVGSSARLVGNPLNWVFVPPLVLALATLSILTQVSLRLRRFRAISTRGVAQNLTLLAVQGGAGMVGGGPAWLAVGELGARSVGAASLWPSLRELHAEAGFRCPQSRRGLWLRYGGVVKHYLPAGLLEAVLGASLVLLTKVWFGSAVAGSLALAIKVIAGPVALVGSTLGQALVAELSHHRRSGGEDSSGDIRRLMWRLASAGFAVFATVFALAPTLLPALLGSDWVEAGMFGAALSFNFGVAVVWGPLSHVYVVFEAWRRFLSVAGLRLGLSLFTGIAFHAAGLGPAIVVGGMASADALVQILGVAMVPRFIAAGSNRPVEQVVASDA